MCTVKNYIFKIAFYCRQKGFQFQFFDHLRKLLEIVMGWWLDDNVATMTKIMMIRNMMKNWRQVMLMMRLKETTWIRNGRRRKWWIRRNMIIVIIADPAKMSECFFFGTRNKMCHFHALWVCKYIDIYTFIFIRIYIYMYTYCIRREEITAWSWF